MLFPYTYVPHQMEKMQTFIDFIFHEVWCKAPANGPFGLHLFDANTELREVMEAFYYSDKKGADFFYSHVERIYGLFSALTATQISQFQQWYQSNNDLDKACTNDPAVQIIRYENITILHQNLSKLLATFFKGLYSKSLLNLAALRAKIGDIDDHYQAFVAENKMGKCPFCGIGDIKGEHHSKREAYDHYLPKALYPFNSINFRNLAPVCHECNSTYKLIKDPMHSAAGRRKAFNPYVASGYTIHIQVDLQHSDIDTLTPADIKMQFGPIALAEELETWKDVYGIEERYKAKFCAENDGKYWLTQVLDEWKEEGRDPAEFMKTLTRQTQKKPYAECNFLKKPFLDACQQIGIF
ncbi:HNH endonuclease [Pectobacterium carotovorum]|uniref:HNH endonuclease n=1 Tax=Pectobacterium carotovorum TaxID=554 RepID=UPI0037FFD979